MNRDSFIKISGKNWEDEDGASGRVEIDGNKITLYTTVFGSEEVLWDGTIENDTIVFSYTLLGEEIKYEYRLDK